MYNTPRVRMSDQFTPEQRREHKPKFVARNTIRFQLGDEMRYRLHNTDIVRRLPDGSAILNSGGYQTITTKERMNRYMPAGYSLYQEQGLWHVRRHDDGTTIDYLDGMNVPGAFATAGKRGAKAAADAKMWRKRINAFAKSVNDLKCLPEPGSGDCWYCCVRTADGKSLGEVTENVSHLRKHVKDGYLHGSLIFNALQWAGYKNPEFVFHADDHALRRGEKNGAWHCQKSLRRYLLRNLGLVA